MEKKTNWKAAARKLGAMLMALALILAAITPAGEARALETGSGGSLVGGILDALKSSEETPAEDPVTEDPAAEDPAAEDPATEGNGEGSGDELDTPEQEITGNGDNSISSVENSTSVFAAMGDVEAVAESDADVTVEQGGTATYTLNYSNYYTYRVSPSNSGLTVTGSRNNRVNISASEDTPAGTYTVTYYSNNQSRGTFTVEVTAADNGGGTGGSGTGTPEIEETQRMSMEKVATARGDGSYDLSLSLSGSIGSQTNKAKVDVIFIVDNSNSMYPDKSTYMSQLKPAMQALIDNLSTTNGDKIDARYGIAMFGTNSEIRLNFTNASTARTSIGNISQYSNTQNGGTNYQGGIYQGKALLNSVRDGATSIVIFVTDGLPTYRGAPNKTGGDGQNDNDGRNIAAAVNEIDNMNCNYFYCIGIGNNFTNTGRTEYQNMAKLTAAVNATTTGIHSVSSTNVSALTNVFNNISAEVTSFLCSNVTVTDTLSNVEGELMVEVSDHSSVKVEVITPDKTYGPAASVTLPETESNDRTTLTAVYENGVLKLDFPDAYQLEAGYTYKLHAVIEPTEKAYQQYRETGYTDTGAAGTGTHAGEQGFYCNESATVTYTYKGETGTAVYNHPVIQLHPGTLNITKKIIGMEVETMEALSFPVTITYPDGTEEILELPLNMFDYDEATDTYSISIDGLSPDTAYSVSESGGEVAGYTINTTVDGKSGKEVYGEVSFGKTVTLNYINTYVKTDKDLETGSGTITISGEKIWDDNNNASNVRPEKLSVTLEGFDGTNWTTVQTIEVTPDADGKWQFSYDVSSCSYLEYRFVETVPDYYEETYNQPSYEFSYPDAQADWKDYTSSSELTVADTNGEKAIVVSQIGSDFIIWSYDALTPGEQALVIESVKLIESDLNDENVKFYYGTGSIVLGMTVTADKISYLNPSKWSSVYAGVYSRGNESATTGTITNKLATSDVVVTKDVSGNLGDRSLDFEFTATLSSGSFAAGEGYTVSADGKTATFNLKHAEQVVLKNVPLGAYLTISETNGNYVVTVKVGETEYKNGDAITVVPDLQIDFYNYYNQTVEHGIELDSVPYVMMLLIAASAVFFMILRKRMVFED